MKTYEDLLRETSKELVHPQFHPVHLLSEEGSEWKWVGSGTLILGGHIAILTCEHIFRPNLAGRKLYYRLLQPLSNDLFPIADFKRIGEGETDVGVCYPGIEAQAINYTSSKQKLVPFEVNALERFDPTLKCMHLLTGREFQLIGRMVLPKKNIDEAIYLVDYEGVEGESGSGFLINAHQLFILHSKVQNLDAYQEFFRIDCSTKKISMGNIVTII